LMQQSGHVGKILVTGPRPGLGAVTAGDGSFAADPDGVHVITGGLGGFGLEAALWLADHGARSIVLTSRSGTLNDQARSALEQLGSAGVATEVAVCDVTDQGALADLLARLRKDRPIRGVLHAAMVLDDALIHNLDGSRIDAVLAPKIAGADNLDRLTRH